MNLENVLASRSAKTIYRDGDTVAKVFDNHYSKSDILNEALNTVRVEETGLPIPEVVQVTNFEGKWAIVYKYIEGKTLAQLMEENPSKIDEYLNLFVDLQMEIHEKRAPLLIKLKDKMSRKISASKLDATIRYELHSRLGSMPKHEKVCHGDFNPSNIIVSDSGKAYILDWAHATQGNASADVARSYLLFCLAGKTEIADAYMKLFCTKSDTAKQYIQKWLPIVAASQSTKEKAEESELLMKWVNIVEYE